VSGPAEGGGVRARRMRRLLGIVGVLAFLAAVVAYYVYVVSAGHWSRWPQWTAYVDTQAEGFRAGHLYTTVPPNPIMHTLAEPLNPINMRYWRWDYSYYRDHVYLYWGLAPAAFLAAAKAFFKATEPVGDHVLVFAFLVGRALAGTLLIRAMARKISPAPPAWSVWLAMAVFAFAHPTPYLLARGSVYEAAIAGGACFLVAGLAFLFQALFAAGPRATGGWLVGAGLSFGLAGCCRVSLFPAGAALVAVAIAARWQAEGARAVRPRRVAVLAACAAVPFGAVVLAHMLLNRLRFGAWTEFGHRFQMGKSWSMGPRFLVGTLWSYFVRKADLTCHFPYLISKWHERDHIPLRDHLPSWMPAHEEFHGGEPTAGLLVLAPFVLLALGLVVRRHGAPGERDPAHRWRWMLIAIGVSIAGGLGPVLMASAATMRYEADFASGMLLLAILGGWRLLRAPAGRAARAGVAAVFAALALFTILAGVALGYTSYFDHFARHNPLLMSRLDRRYNVCKERR